MGVEIIVPVAFFISITLMVIFMRKFANDERMAMIEKGVDAKSLHLRNRFAPMRYGLLLLGAGVGILLSSILVASISNINEEATYFSLVLIFSGLGLLASYQIEAKHRNQSDV